MFQILLAFISVKRKVLLFLLDEITLLNNEKQQFPDINFSCASGDV